MADVLRQAGESDFVARHIGPSPAEQQEMAEAVGVRDVAELIREAVPDAILNAGVLEDSALPLGEGHSEREALAQLQAFAARNTPMVSMIGQGYYGTVTPSVILRNVLESPAWYTAYTPYQAEISQGRLQALMNYQQMVSDLSGMEIANASLLDEASAAAEAMAMMRRISRSPSRKLFVEADCLAQTLAVLRTRAAPLDIEILVAPLAALPAEEVFGVILSYPGSSGTLHDIEAAVAMCNEAKTLVAVASDLLALTLIKPPGEMGCDIVFGSAQRFGVPMGCGGPHAAFFATRKAHMRQTPGRIIGVSTDSHGRTAFRMALQTREQHIRREKATSNICTAQALLANIAGFYAIYHGAEGVRAIATRVHMLASQAATACAAMGLDVRNHTFFDTLTLACKGKADALASAARHAGINVFTRDETHISISFDETHSSADLARLCTAWAHALGVSAPELSAPESAANAGHIPQKLRRTSAYLTHEVFQRFRSETNMMRYLRRLADKDIGLDRAMIPLGSCTMKLNAATEMMPISWPEFANIHPFAPAEQMQGYIDMIADLSQKLCAITGYDALCMQPNSGAQGEFSGLMTIRAYHTERGEGHRNICLVPLSAHGTNPASAQMAGYKVVTVNCSPNGNIDIDDLEAKARAHAEHLAALMVTYPSTHGVFEEGIRTMCDICHKFGGQVYMDGANLNAMLGLCRPGDLGSDVSHLNLHKTFCIPHGGGGPGMGPIGVKAHLAPYLPDHAHRISAPGIDLGTAGKSMGPVAAAPFGSALILPISWAYIYLCGAAGLRRSAEIAILNANYLATRLKPFFSDSLQPCQWPRGA